jgi:uncharacterized protein (DUF433 family)
MRLTMPLDLLGAGIYTIPEAAGLVEATQPEMRVWIEGRPGKQEPVIENDLGRLGRKIAVSFTNLMELRFVALFSNAGVRLNEIRAILGEARNTLQHPHPFATNVVFKTDGRKIVAEIARKNGVKNIYDLKGKNYEMRVIVMDSLKEDVVFDPKGDAISWRPRPKIAPHVFLHPALSFGRPIIMPSRIPTEALAKAVKAEGNVAMVAKLFEIPVAQVREAVSFNDNLRQAA